MLRAWLQRWGRYETTPRADWVRDVHDEDLQLHCCLTAGPPVQAEGTLAGQPLYFRARWDEWSFAVSDWPDLNPVDIQSPDAGFYREARYGAAGGDDAGYMELGEAEAIVRRCAREYLATQPSS